jgi:hypothetical protein
MHTSSKGFQPLHLQNSLGGTLSIQAHDIYTCGITPGNCQLERHRKLWQSEVESGDSESEGAANWLIYGNL